MKRRVLLPLGALLLCSFGLAASKDQTFQGEIMDPQCAMDGTHAGMAKKVGMGGMDLNDPKARKMCSEICIKMGGKYVLYDASSKKVYELDDQNKAKQFAGQNVKVSGTLDKLGEKIHITNIEPGS